MELEIVSFVEIANYGKKTKQDIVKLENPKLKNIKVVLTGSFKNYRPRSLLENKIKRNGGTVNSKVDKSVNYLIIGNNYETNNSKFIAAKHYNIRIINIKTFEEKFNIWVFYG